MDNADRVHDLAADLAHSLDPALEPGRIEVASPAAVAAIASKGRWVTAAHLELINRRLVDLAAGRNRRLLIAAPPRHGKSELCDVYLPMWYLGRYPNRRIILASYEADFAASWGRRVRDGLAEWGPMLFGIRIADESAAAARFDIAGHAGGMTCAGVGGPITGKGAHLLITDDGVKNAEDVATLAARDRLWDWFRSVALTRLEPGGAVIVIGTRWHEDDLVGRILAHQDESGEAWESVRLPALAEDDDVLGRAPGEALWPTRYPVAELESVRNQLGSTMFACMYQGSPRPEHGVIFHKEHFRYFTQLDDAYDIGVRVVPASKCVHFATVDLAASLKTAADFTVVEVFARTPQKELLLLDVVRRRLEGPDQVPLIKGIFDRYRLSEVYIEKAGYQLVMIQEARRDGLPVRELIPDRDKISRALVAAARMETGDVYFLRGAHFIDDLESELLSFPNATHDDQVDCLGYAALQLAQDGWTRDEIYSMGGYIACPVCEKPTPPRGERYGRYEVVVTSCINCGAELPKRDITADAAQDAAPPAPRDPNADPFADIKRWAAHGGGPYGANITSPGASLGFCQSGGLE